jgi:hypothetical protein
VRRDTRGLCSCRAPADDRDTAVVGQQQQELEQSMKKTQRSEHATKHDGAKVGLTYPGSDPAGDMVPSNLSPGHKSSGSIVHQGPDADKPHRNEG